MTTFKADGKKLGRVILSPDDEDLKLGFRSLWTSPEDVKYIPTRRMFDLLEDDCPTIYFGTRGNEDEKIR